MADRYVGQLKSLCKSVYRVTYEYRDLRQLETADCRLVLDMVAWYIQRGVCGERKQRGRVTSHILFACVSDTMSLVFANWFGQLVLDKAYGSPPGRTDPPPGPTDYLTNRTVSPSAKS